MQGIVEITARRVVRPLQRRGPLDLPGRQRADGDRRRAHSPHPHSIRTYLDGVGLPSRAPPIAAARPEPQLHFDAAA